MGDWNPNSPALVGSEWNPTHLRTVDIGDNPLYGIAQRVNPGAITPTAFHTFDKKPNKNSLHSVELVDTLVPDDLQTETLWPGTNTGAYNGGSFVTETGAAADFGRLNKSNGFDDSKYLVTTSPSDLTPTGALAVGYDTLLDSIGEFSLAYRMNRASKYTAAGLRVVSVTVNARVATTNSAYTGFMFGVSQFTPSSTGQPNVNVAPGQKLLPDGTFRTYSYTLPGDPWAMASIRSGLATGRSHAYWQAPHYSKTWDDIVTTGGPFTFGIIPINTLGSGASAQPLQISALWLTVSYCTENRCMASYPRTPLAAGWNKTAALAPTQRVITFTSNAANTALTTPAGGTAGAGSFTVNDVGAKIVRASDGQVVGTISSVTNATTAVLTANGASSNAGVVGYLGTQPTALSASTYYWLVHGQTAWTAATSVQMDVLLDQNLYVQSDPTASGQHRTCYDLLFTSPGSMVAETATQTAGEMLPTLIDSGTIAAESQPYTTLGKSVEIWANQSVGQQLTTAASTTYVGVRVSVSRFVDALLPDKPLTVEIRHGAGALTGGGTLDASVTLQPAQLTDVSLAVGAHSFIESATLLLMFDAPFTSILSQQYVVYFTSASSSVDGNGMRKHGWAVMLLDTHSDQLGTGTTAANVEGASIGGQTDGYDKPGGAVTTRYDTAVTLLTLPGSAPADLVATAMVAA